MKIIFAVSVAIGSVVWSCYVGSVLWAWIVVPVLGLPALSIVEVLGVGLVARAVTGFQPTTDDGKREGESPGTRIVRLIATAALIPFVLLVGGWILKSFLL